MAGTTAAATMAGTATTVAETTDVGVRNRFRLLPSSLRTRILAAFVGFLVLAIAASVFVTREVLLLRLDRQIDAALVQEAAELRRLARGVDPATGRRFGSDVERIFEVFLQRNVPSRNEALITFIDARPYLRSRAVLPYRLDRDPELVARWGRIVETERGRVQTPAGRIEYLAVPLQREGETRGVFVAAIFRDREKAEIETAIRAAGAVGLAILLVGSLLAWRLARRVVEPVASLTRTARAISETDFGRRIPVETDDEVGQLAATFNEMLDRLERAFEAQRRFVDDAGHELRTPLTIARGHLELLGDDPEERRQTVGLVLDELDRMRRIVDDLLLLAKHEQPDFLDLETVEIGAMTDELHAKVSALAPRDWTVERRGRGVVVADRQRVTQAVVQLAENAAGVTDDGERIELGSEVVNGEARIWVRDRGPGIPLREQPRIFERFRRGRDERRSEGAGLGLAIVKAIAEAHHGRIEVDSRPGAGATFTLVVPVDQPQEQGEERT
ncbi:MAG TPA: ATP-binding protein [Gaiellaceae bacterium]|nr:ATP-binding protein [Gaiellaceae bacterium]